MAVGLIVILMDYITMRPVGGSAGRARSPCSVGSVSDLIVFLPDNVEKVLASQFHHQHHLMALEWCTHEVITPWPHAKPYSVGSGYRTSPTNCDDPVHGSGGSMAS